MSRKLFALLISFFMLTGCTFIRFSPSNNLPLMLTITPDKKAYHIGETINITLKLENIGSKRLLVYGRMDFVTFSPPPEFSLGTIFIQDPKGNPISYKRFANIAWQPQKGDFIYLDPGDVITKLEYVEDSNKYSIIGMYTITALYQNSFDPGDVFENSTDQRESWKGEIHSNTIVVELRP